MPELKCARWVRAGRVLQVEGQRDREIRMTVEQWVVGAWGGEMWGMGSRCPDPPQALEIVLHSTDWILEAVYKCEVTKGFEVQGLTQAGVI